MRLKRIGAERYKNLVISKNFELNNLNIFIGPNGSGKSNYIHLLKFLWLTQRGSFFEALGCLGGKDALDRTVASSGTVKLDFSFDAVGEQMDSVVLEVLISLPENGQSFVQNENLHSNAQNPFYFYRFNELGGNRGVVSVFNAGGKGSHFEILDDIPSDRLGLEMITELLEHSEFSPEATPVYKIRRGLLDFIRGWSFFNGNDMDLNEIRTTEPKISPQETLLNRTCTNLAAVIENLIQSDLNFEEQLNEGMKRILPLTRKVRAVRTGLNSLTVEWHMDGMQKPLYLSALSDGTVRMLCWATILFAPSLPTLLVLDEPELGLHLSWLETLAEWIKRAARRTQVILCTHSPDLLDYFTADHLENVIRFQPASDHHFQLARLAKAEVQEALDEGWELGDLYRVGDPNLGG